MGTLNPTHSLASGDNDVGVKGKLIPCQHSALMASRCTRSFVGGTRRRFEVRSEPADVWAANQTSPRRKFTGVRSEFRYLSFMNR